MFELLKPVCSQDETRAHLTQPFRIELGGEAWTAATDGHRMVVVRGEYAPEREDAPPIAPTIQSLGSAEGVVIDTEALRAWAGPDPGPQIIPCWKCEATGVQTCTRCDGSGERECICYCGDKHSSTCGDCDGDKEVECEECGGDYETRREANPASFLGRAVNRDLLPAMLASAPPSIRAHLTPNADGPIYLWGDGWYGVIMPMIRTEPLGEPFEVK